MIFKRDLLRAVDELTCQIIEQGMAIRSLEEDVRKLKKQTCKCEKNRLEKAIEDVTKPKRRGRPVGSKNKTTKSAKE